MSLFKCVEVTSLGILNLQDPVILARVYSNGWIDLKDVVCLNDTEQFKLFAASMLKAIELAEKLRDID